MALPCIPVATAESNLIVSLLSVFGVPDAIAASIAPFGVPGLILISALYFMLKIWPKIKKYIEERDKRYDKFSETLKEQTAIFLDCNKSMKDSIDSYTDKLNDITCDLSHVRENTQLILSEESGELSDVLVVSTTSAYFNLVIYRISEFFNYRVAKNHIDAQPVEVKKKYFNFGKLLSDKLESQLFKYRYKGNHVSDFLANKAGQVLLQNIMLDLYQLHLRYYGNQTSNGILINPEDKDQLREHFEKYTSWWAGAINRWCSTGELLDHYMINHLCPSPIMIEEEELNQTVVLEEFEYKQILDEISGI